jgi:hypothetical protein
MIYQSIPFETHLLLQNYNKSKRLSNNINNQNISQEIHFCLSLILLNNFAPLSMTSPDICCDI